MNEQAKNIILCGDVIEQLKTLPDKYVYTCITSPPYFGLRDYGTATWEGGDASCDHTITDGTTDPKKNTKIERPTRGVDRSVCRKCGATRMDAQIGIENTYQEYIDKLVLVFREVRRVLRDDGTLWLNLGDSYAGSGGAGNQFKQLEKEGFNTYKQKMIPCDIKPKNLIGIPWRVALALQADGWYLRQDIIWHKLNPMPESVKDRCTKSHEYIFLLSKSGSYHYDQDAIREPYTEPMNRWGGEKLKADGVSTWDKGTGQSTYIDRDLRPNKNGKNKRTVWTVNTKPYKEAHFAVFPEKLIEPCVLAGCPEGGIVLDVFGGSGTTGVVAKKHKRNYILIELNPEYTKIAEKRLKYTECPLFISDWG